MPIVSNASCHMHIHRVRLEAEITELKSRQSELESCLHSKHVEIDAMIKNLHLQVQKKKRVKEEVYICLLKQ